eukprot:evm.model.scf_1257.2 EVM.evm.TU.scf_1257.2   scf_1257:25060-26094(-)
MRRAVLHGKMTSREGAVHLMGVLSRIEGETGERLLSLSELKQRYVPCSQESGDVGQYHQNCQDGAPGSSDMWQGAERLEDTPSMVVSRPVPSASPISPPSEPRTDSEEVSPFASVPPTLGPMHGLAPARSVRQSAPQLLWQKKGLTGIDLPLRTTSYGSNGQERGTFSPSLGQGAASMGRYDFYNQGLGASTGAPGFPQHPLQGTDGGLGLRQGISGLSQRDTAFSQNAATAGMGQAIVQPGRDMMRSGFGAPSLPSLGSSSVGGVPGMSGNQWGAHQSVQRDMPQYIPPDIAAIRGIGLGGTRHESVCFGLEPGVAPQALHQQVTERLRINGGRGEHLQRGWK